MKDKPEENRKTSVHGVNGSIFGEHVPDLRRREHKLSLHAWIHELMRAWFLLTVRVCGRFAISRQAGSSHDAVCCLGKVAQQLEALKRLFL